MARDLKVISTDELLELASEPTEGVELGEVVAELITRYECVVYSRALRVCGGNRALADEVFQETFLRIFSWLQDRRDHKTLHTFPRLLSVFTKRAAIDLMRKENRETASGRAEEAALMPAEDEGAWETKAYAQELLEQLDPRSREIIRLTYFEGLSAVEIAKRLALQPGNVRILRFRALEALRARQEKDNFADLIEPL